MRRKLAVALNALTMTAGSVSISLAARMSEPIDLSVRESSGDERLE